MSNEIEEQTKEVIKKIISINMGIHNLHSINDDLGADSLDRMEITMALEEKFKIDIPNNTIDDWVNVQNIIDDVTALVIY